MIWEEDEEETGEVVEELPSICVPIPRTAVEPMVVIRVVLPLVMVERIGDVVIGEGVGARIIVEE